MSEILSWFRKRRYAKIVSEFEKYSEYISKVVKDLEILISEWIDGKYSVKYFDTLHAKERDADTMRRGILELLAESTLDSSIKVYLARVARRADLIADWCLESARIIDILSEEGSRLDKRVSRTIKSMIKDIVKASQTTERAIKVMFSDPISALNLCDKVERIEEDVDAIYQELRRTYSSISKEENMKKVVLIYEFFDALENVADRCEDTCDSIREFVVTRT